MQKCHPCWPGGLELWCDGGRRFSGHTDWRAGIIAYRWPTNDDNV